jgi:tRNA nucleotidyltransferase (CCA-adding enzyme)
VLIKQVRAMPSGAALLARLPADLVPAVYLVGGSVRDLMLGCVASDLDLVVDGPAAMLADRFGGRARSHDRFGTVTVTVDGAAYDVATARRERYAHPGALPEVEPASLDEDLLRRDFTVNAIAIALTGPERGRLRAAPGGLRDLSQRTLRVMHAASFIDDPTRLLRLARYRARLGFTVDQLTLRLARAAVEGGALGSVSGARVGNELRAIAREREPIGALRALRELAIDQAIAPGFGIADPDLAQRAFGLLPADGRRELLALALAARGLSASALRALLDDLAFESEERDAIVVAATRCAQLAEALRAAARPSEIAAAVGGASIEMVAIAGALGPAQPARQWLSVLRHVALQIHGSDLLAAGVPQGPAIGRGLRAALAAALDGRAASRELQLQEALAAARARA